MDRNTILSLLKQQVDRLKVQYGLRSLSLFGSAARDEMHTGSDIDILVRFLASPSFDAYMELKFELEKLFGRRVDLVTNESVKPRMRPIIEQDLIDVA